MVEGIDEFTEGGNFPENPYIWETEPKENTGLDIYYEISENNPITLNANTIITAIPVGSKVENTSGFGLVDWTGVSVSNNISALGECAHYFADMNRDGVVDIFDIRDILVDICYIYIC